MWNKEKLLEVKTKTVKICGDDVVIRKLKAGEVLGKGQEDDKAVDMVAASLVEPKLSVDEVRELPLEIMNAILEEILSFNGMNKEAKQGN